MKSFWVIIYYFLFNKAVFNIDLKHFMWESRQEYPESFVSKGKKGER